MLISAEESQKRVNNILPPRPVPRAAAAYGRQLKISDVTVERHSTFFLLQNISMAIQLGNAACIIGTVQVSDGLEELLKFVKITSEI